MSQPETAAGRAFTGDDYWPDHEPDCPMYEHPNDRTAPTCTCRALNAARASETVEAAHVGLSIGSAWEALANDDRMSLAYSRRAQAFADHRPVIEAAIRAEQDALITGYSEALEQARAEPDARVAEARAAALDEARAAVARLHPLPPEEAYEDEFQAQALAAIDALRRDADKP